MIWTLGKHKAGKKGKPDRQSLKRKNPDITVRVSGQNVERTIEAIHRLLVCIETTNTTKTKSKGHPAR